MKVRELIEALEAQPPDDDVYYSDDGEHVMDIRAVYHVSVYGEHYVMVEK